MKKIRDPGRQRLRTALVAAAALIFIGAAIPAGVWFQRSRLRHEGGEIKRAIENLDHGFEWVARALLEPREGKHLKSRDGCVVLIRTYTATHETEQLGAAAETCLENGIETREILSGLARHRKWIGDAAGEQRILFETSERYPKFWESFHELASALHRGGREQEAGKAYLQAVNINPGRISLSLEALEFLEDQGRTREALAIAVRLHQAKDPALFIPRSLLLVARAILRGPDPGLAREIAKKARELLKDKPLQAAELRKTFSTELSLGD